MPNAYLDTYAAVGNREDLINLITNISYEETVFMSRIGNSEARLTKHEWLTETLQASNSGNSVIEGASAAFASGDITVRARVSNYTQILRKPFSTSYTEGAVTIAGIDDEFNHQRELKTKEIARDINAAMINQVSASGTSAAARTMNGALAAITTNSSDAGNTVLGQGLYNQLQQNIWVQGGRPNATYVHGFNKRTISSWSQPLMRTIDATGKKLVVSVDIYDSDFGRQMILLEREMSTTALLTIEEKYWRKAWLRPLFFEEIGKIGGARRGTVESEVTLEYLAENSSGKMINLQVLAS